MKKQNFPKIYNAVGQDKMRPTQMYAIIEDGKIIATNGLIMIYSDFDNYVSNPELAEGKIFSKDLLKLMSKKDFEKIECTETGVRLYYKNGLFEEEKYSGYICDDRKMFIFGMTDMLGRYPDWKKVTKKEDGLVYEGLNSFNVSAEGLTIISECFCYEDENRLLTFEFDGRKDNYAYIYISPCVENTFYKNQKALIFATRPTDMYYRVFDTQRGGYFATGYNAESMNDLITSFRSYIRNGSNCPDGTEGMTDDEFENYFNGLFDTWGKIADHLQGVKLEKSSYKFDEVDMI